MMFCRSALEFRQKHHFSGSAASTHPCRTLNPRTEHMKPQRLLRLIGIAFTQTAKNRAVLTIYMAIKVTVCCMSSACLRKLAAKQPSLLMASTDKCA